MNQHDAFEHSERSKDERLLQRAHRIFLWCGSVMALTVIAFAIWGEPYCGPSMLR